MSNYKLNEKMNKKLFFLVVMLGMALQGMAQEPFTVTKFPFRKFVRLNDGVNLRQSPSANSPRLVLRVGESTEGCADNTETIWLNRPLRKNEQAVRATILPVWEQSFKPKIKVADGWLCGYYDTPPILKPDFRDEDIVYVMEKFCEPVSLRPLSKDEDVKSLSDLEDLVVIKSGEYKDYCIATSDDGETFYLNLGKYVGGVFIFKYNVMYSRSFDPDENESSYDERAEEFCGTFYYGNKIAKDPKWLWGVDLHKLVRDKTSMDILMKKVVKMQEEKAKEWWEKYSFPTYTTYYYGIEGDKKWYRISLEN